MLKNIEQIFKQSKKDEKKYYIKYAEKLGNLRDQYKEGKLSLDEYRSKHFKARMIHDMERSISVNKKITHKEIALIRQYLVDTGRLNRFKYNKVKYELPKRVRTNEAFVNHIRKVNAFSLIFKNLSFWKPVIQDKKDTSRGNNFYPCELIENNIAWIAQDPETKEWRYFSKKVQGNSISLSIFDLIQLVDGKGVGYSSSRAMIESVRKLTQLLGVSYPQIDWEFKQIDKYNNNIHVLGAAEKEMKRDYPELYSFIKTYIPLLLFMNANARALTPTKASSYKNNAIYFRSMTSLAVAMYGEKTVIKKVKKKCPLTDEVYEEEEKKVVANRRSGVVKAINAFALLGLLNKVPHEELPKPLLNRAIKMRQLNPKFKLINFYTFPEYNHEILKKAENMVKRIKKKGITKIGNVSAKNVGEAVGAKTASKVYFNDPNLLKMKYDEQLEKYESMYDEYFEYMEGAA